MKFGSTGRGGNDDQIVIQLSKQAGLCVFIHAQCSRMKWPKSGNRNKAKVNFFFSASNKSIWTKFSEFVRNYLNFDIQGNLLVQKSPYGRGKHRLQAYILNFKIMHNFGYTWNIWAK